MSQERFTWILAYKFADFYATEEAWQKDFKLFKDNLKTYDKTKSS